MSEIQADSLTIEEEPGWVIKTDLFGIQVLTRPYKGPRADLAKFLKQLEQTPKDRENPDLRVTEWDFRGERGLIVSGTVTYKGVPGSLSGKPTFSRTTIKKSLVTKTAILRAANDQGQQIEIRYKAPATTYMYARATEPTAARFAGEMKYFKSSFRIISARGQKGLPIVIVSNSNGLRSPFTNRDSYYAKIQIYTEILDAEQVGDVWQVTERNDGLLTDAYDGIRDDIGADTREQKENEQAEKDKSTSLFQ